MSKIKYETVNIENDDDFLFSVDNIEAPKVGNSGIDRESVSPTKKDNTSSHDDSKNLRGVFNVLAPYYQVTNEQLYYKLLCALKLEKVQALEMATDSNIEVYSSFWIIISASIFLYLSSWAKNLLTAFIEGSSLGTIIEEYTIFINILWVCSAYVVLVPVFLKLLAKYGFNHGFDTLNFVQWYGIGCIVWIPISMVSVWGAFLPHKVATATDWMLTMVGGAYSFSIIYMQVHDILEELPSSKQIIIAIGLLHTLFSIAIKFLIL